MALITTSGYSFKSYDPVVIKAKNKTRKSSQMKLLPLLAYIRIPGNAFSFLVRRMLRWSRGTAALRQEPKDNLFVYLQDGHDAAETRAAGLLARYQLEPLIRLSTASLYRKNLYLLDVLEKATDGLHLPFHDHRAIKALDVGSQDWYYVFALERWLQRNNRTSDDQVDLTGVELDGYEIFADFHSRKDYALAYVEQTGNPNVRYEIGDFLKCTKSGHDIVFMFYPLVLRYQVLLWGLPLRYFAPGKMLQQAAALTRPGGWLVVFCHNLSEHQALLKLAHERNEYRLLRAGQVVSTLIDFQGEANDNRFSIWQKWI